MYTVSVFYIKLRFIIYNQIVIIADVETYIQSSSASHNITSLPHADP